MGDLTVGQIIKMILGMAVVVIVIMGLYMFFKNKFLGFFKSLPGGNVSNLAFSLIR